MKSVVMDMSVSHEWIYRYIATDNAQGGTLYKTLRQGRKRYARGVNSKRRVIPNPRFIDECPAVVTLSKRKSRTYKVRKVAAKRV